MNSFDQGHFATTSLAGLVARHKIRPKSANPFESLGTTNATEARLLHLLWTDCGAVRVWGEPLEVDHWTATVADALSWLQAKCDIDLVALISEELRPLRKRILHMMAHSHACREIKRRVRRAESSIDSGFDEADVSAAQRLSTIESCLVIDEAICELITLGFPSHEIECEIRLRAGYTYEEVALHLAAQTGCMVSPESVRKRRTRNPALRLALQSILHRGTEVAA